MQNLSTTFEAIDLHNLSAVCGGAGDDKHPTFMQRVNRTVDAGNRYATGGAAAGGVIGGVVGGIAASPTGPGIVAGIGTGIGLGTLAGGALGWAVGAGGSVINQLRGH